MRTISNDLKTEIAKGTIARLLKIDCTNGSVFAFTDTDMPITVEGQLYTPAPGLQSVKLTSTSNVEVSNQSIGAAMLDVPEEDLLGGVFDSAVITASWASWANPAAGKVDVFSGVLGELTWDERGFLADVVSTMKQLERNIGWSYTNTCRHGLFSTTEVGKIGKCGLSSASYTFSGAVTSVALNKWKFGTGLSQATGYFSSGVLTWVTGNNAGLSVTIKSQVSGNLEVYIPTAFTIQVGDTFTIQAGCDKTMATCRDKFSNLNNFGGFPHIQQDASFR